LVIDKYHNRQDVHFYIGYQKEEGAEAAEMVKARERERERERERLKRGRKTVILKKH